MLTIKKKSILTKIILVGCGNIGSRHLESLMNFQNKISIDIVEPNKKSKTNAIRLIKKLHIKNPPKMTWYNSIEDLDNNAEVVIVATNSLNRIPLIDILLKQGNKKFILEKMVCQSKKEYKLLINSFNKYSAKAWVNTNRSYFPFYKKIKTIFSNSKSIQLSVYLGNSGLGTSSIHYIDLFCWLSNNYNIKLNQKYLSDKIFSSKRGKSFKEFSGVIVGSNSKNSYLSISSQNNPKIPPSAIVEIYDGQKHIVINELQEKFYFLTNYEKIPKLTFKFRHVSELTHKIIREILTNDSCSLPTVENSFKIHSELFRIFNSHLYKHLNQKMEKCPIT